MRRFLPAFALFCLPWAVPAARADEAPPPAQAPADAPSEGTYDSLISTFVVVAAAAAGLFVLALLAKPLIRARARTDLLSLAASDPWMMRRIAEMEAARERGEPPPESPPANAG